MELRSIADRELSRLENDAQMLRAVYPRWILLKASSCRLSGRQTAASGYFNQVWNINIKNTLCLIWFANDNLLILF